MFYNFELMDIVCGVTVLQLKANLLDRSPGSLIY